MNAAETLADEIATWSTWTEICERCPDEWVCLLDAGNAPDVRSGWRVLGHDRSMRRMLAQMRTLQPNMVVAHTSDRPLQSARFELTGEIRDIVRPFSTAGPC